MAEPVPFMIGAEASCTDSKCGRVTRIVVDPVARVVTHIVVEPAGRQGLGRLVPLHLVDAGADEVRLRCTMAEFEQLDSAEETQFVPGSQGYAQYGAEQVISWPYFPLTGTGVSGDTLAGTSQTVTYDMVPLGEVEVRRGAHVHATDGQIGQVEGLVIDPVSHHVTHVLLKEGHLWGRRDVAVPIAAVTAADDDAIYVDMTKDGIADLPAVDIEHLTST